MSGFDLAAEIERLAEKVRAEERDARQEARAARLRRRVAELLDADPRMSANAVYAALKEEKPGTRAQVLAAVRDAKSAGTAAVYHP